MGTIATQSTSLNRLFRRRSKKISKLRVTGLCARNSSETGEFPATMASGKCFHLMTSSCRIHIQKDASLWTHRYELDVPSFVTKLPFLCPPTTDQLTHSLRCEYLSICVFQPYCHAVWNRNKELMINFVISHLNQTRNTCLKYVRLNSTWRRIFCLASRDIDEYYIRVIRRSNIVLGRHIIYIAMYV